jgi:Uma2 family endonuclease
MRTDELISVREYLTTGPKPKEQIFRTPPLICIEILSPEDRLSKVQERLDDCPRFGVPYIFLLDPRTRKAHRWTAQGMLEITALRTENPATVVPLEALFE